MLIIKGGERKEIHPVDYPGWREAGWKTEDDRGILGASESEQQHELSTATNREQQLQALDWKELEKLAKELGIEKPSGVSWREMIPAIVEAEQPTLLTNE